MQHARSGLSKSKLATAMPNLKGFRGVTAFSGSLPKEPWEQNGQSYDAEVDLKW